MASSQRCPLARNLPVVVCAVVGLLPALVTAAGAETTIRPDAAIVEPYGFERDGAPIPPYPFPGTLLFRFSGPEFRVEWDQGDKSFGGHRVLHGRVDGCAVTGWLEGESWNASTDYRWQVRFPLEGRYSESGALELWADARDEGFSEVFGRPMGAVYRFRFSRVDLGSGCGTPVSPPPTAVPSQAPLTDAPGEPAPGEAQGPVAGEAAPEGAARAPGFELPARTSGGSSETAATGVGVSTETGGTPLASPWSVPVSPGAAAGAAGAVALTSLLGALWMFGASGLGPADLLGSAPAGETDTSGLSEQAAVEPPLSVAPEVHRDGDVNAETDEVWSESVGGWVGANYHELERRAQAEVRRAQAVSDAESRRDSARAAEELRASRERQAAAERREAQVAEEALRAEAVTIEPYRPGWTDRATGALEWAEWGADTSMSILAGMTGPGGEALAAGYTTVKETAKGISEGVALWSRGQGGHLAGEGSAWVLVERTTVGFGRGAAKVWLDKGAGKVLDRGLDRFGGAGTSQLLDAGEAVVTTVARSFVSSAGSETRRSVSIAVGKALASPQVQKPVNWLVEGATGEKM